MQELKGTSKDIVSENIKKLKELFPEVFSEGKIDFKKLEEELGNFTCNEPERYNFTWAGKSEAKKIAQTPSTGTLRPCKKESKNWDTTQNLYIEGDNLEVLKLLQKSYYKQVKMIYIDPPYNTGKDFVYKDNFHDNIKNYLEITGQVDSDGNKLSTNSDTNGRYHSDWLSMMYPRLKLARNLLKDDGVIFISIDDNEVANLKKLCDEIFGEDNFVGQMIRQRIEGGKQDSQTIQTIHEYLLVYGKNIHNKLINKKLQTDFEHYDKVDEFFGRRGKYYLKPLWNSGLNYSESLTYSIDAPDGTIIRLPNDKKTIWLWSENTFLECKKNGFIEFVKNKNNEYKVYYKTYQLVDKFDNIIERSTPYNSMFLEGYTNRQSAKNIKSLFHETDLFGYAKPLLFLNDLILMGSDIDAIVLDFFSGSSTTAHAIMQLNAEDEGNRKFIMVQLPETTDNEEYPTICDIGKERIRRAGEKIIADNSDKDLSNLDIGFKVLKLDSSNIKAWDSNFENVEGSLLNAVENIKEDRSSEDLLYEILLKYGLDLTLPIEEKVIDGKKVFVIGYGALVACLDDDITIEAVEAIAKLKEEYQSEIMRVVFKDASFKDAVVKTNAYQILKQFGIDEVVSI
ncbi:MAG: site-specific DNA-methyltransferase [Campylobacteraceae bacterium]|nr:site-specific DNA-methyltransferase [Campylobacteraceae bacterium]